MQMKIIGIIHRSVISEARKCAIQQPINDTPAISTPLWALPITDMFEITVVLFHKRWSKEISSSVMVNCINYWEHSRICLEPLAQTINKNVRNAALLTGMPPAFSFSPCTKITLADRNSRTAVQTAEPPNCAAEYVNKDAACAARLPV